jgi:hypothetical protein
METLDRLKELQQLQLVDNRGSIINHIIACDSLMFGEKVDAHRNLAPSANGPTPPAFLPPGNAGAVLSLVFANYTIVTVGQESVQGYIDDFYARRRGGDRPGLPKNLPNWEKLVERTTVALKELSDSQYDEEQLRNVIDCWPDLQDAVVDARAAFGSVVDQDPPKRLARSDRWIIAAFVAWLSVLWIIVNRFL